MKLSTRKIQEHVIDSRYLNKKMKLLISIPDDYSPLYSYHLVIAQDGDDYFKLGKIQSQTTDLTASNSIERVIIVGIPYETVEERRELYHPDGNKAVSYRHFVVREALPYLEKKFSLHQLAGGRTTIGDSLGGSAALMLAYNYPHTFGNAVLQSPMVNPTLLKTVDQNQKALPLNIYHSIGKKETNVKTTNGKIKDFLAPNRDLNQLLLQQTLAGYTYIEHDGDHTWRSWQAELPNILHLMVPFESV